MSLCTPSKKKPCNFCNSCISDDLKMGKLYQFENIVAHYYCLLLSSGLCQNGRDNEGILGFLSSDIVKELNRGSKLKCTACKKYGATIGCCNKTCKKVFHLPCSLTRDSLHLFYGNFMTYCKGHRPKIRLSCKEVGKEAKIRLSYKEVGKEACFICLESMDLKDPYNAITPPCCKNGHFHKLCIQKQALAAGYFFKCPLCNNSEEFKLEMLNKGIFIPERDAAWELEQNAFQELYTRHSRCDAPTCLCPMGNDYDKDDCPWEVVLCVHCGSYGCHVECGSISKSKLEWQCPGCLEVINKLKSKTEHVEPELGDESTSAIMATPEYPKPPSTPENTKNPAPITPKRRRLRFAQLNEYNLSPNGPINKDDDCSLIRRSPRSSNTRYGEKLRCSKRIGLREYIENELKLKEDSAIQQPSTSKNHCETTVSSEKLLPKVEPKIEYIVLDESSTEGSPSQLDIIEVYSKPGPKSRKRNVNMKCTFKMEPKTGCNIQNENSPQACSSQMDGISSYSKLDPKSRKRPLNVTYIPKLDLKTQDENSPQPCTSQVDDTPPKYSKPAPKSKKIQNRCKNNKASKCFDKNKPSECVEEVSSEPSIVENSSQTICSNPYFNMKPDVIYNKLRKSNKRDTRTKITNKGNVDIRQYFYFSK